MADRGGARVDEYLERFFGDQGARPDSRTGRSVRALVRTHLLSGVGPPFPDTGELVATDSRSGATIFLATRDGRPILAGWRHALGRVALLTNDISGDNAGDWRGWRQLPRNAQLPLACRSLRRRGRPPFLLSHRR